MYLTHVLGSLPVACVQSFQKRLFAPIVVNNLVGPPVDLYLHGDRIDISYGGVNIAGNRTPNGNCIHGWKMDFNLSVHRFSAYLYHVFHSRTAVCLWYPLLHVCWSRNHGSDWFRRILFPSRPTDDYISEQLWSRMEKTFEHAGYQAWKLWSPEKFLSKRVRFFYELITMWFMHLMSIYIHYFGEKKLFLLKGSNFLQIL